MDKLYACCAHSICIILTLTLFFKDLFIYGCVGYFLELGFFVSVQGLSLVAATGGYSLGVVHGLLIAMASLVAEHGLQGMRASVIVARGLSS